MGISFEGGEICHGCIAISSEGSCDASCAFCMNPAQRQKDSEAQSCSIVFELVSSSWPRRPRYPTETREMMEHEMVNVLDFPAMLSGSLHHAWQ